VIHWRSDAFEDDVAEDLEESDQYIPVPHKNDLDLGSNLALRFAAAALPKQYRRVESIFRRRGAYARFKGLLAVEGCLERWYAFESECTETALKRWCEENDIQVIDIDKTRGVLGAHNLDQNGVRVGSRESHGKS
jgi:hypothetical protein